MPHRRRGCGEGELRSELSLEFGKAWEQRWEVAQAVQSRLEADESAGEMVDPLFGDEARLALGLRGGVRR